MSQDVFCTKMLVEQRSYRAKTPSIQTFVTKFFYVTFAFVKIRRRYWELVKAAKSKSPFSCFMGNCPIQKEQRQAMDSRETHL